MEGLNLGDRLCAIRQAHEEMMQKKLEEYPPPSVDECLERFIIELHDTLVQKFADNPNRNYINVEFGRFLTIDGEPFVYTFESMLKEYCRKHNVSGDRVEHISEEAGRRAMDAFIKSVKGVEVQKTRTDCCRIIIN